MRRLSLLLSILLSISSAQDWRSKFPNLILDTLVVPLAVDSLELLELPHVVDGREEGGNYLTTRQKLKLADYIPVDERVVLTDSLSVTLGKSLAADSITMDGRLVIDHLSIWYDTSIPRKKGWVLNGYTRLETVDGETRRDWQWEVREEKKKGKKEKGEEAEETKDGKESGGLSKLFSKKDRPSPEEIQREKFGKLVSRWMALQGEGLNEKPTGVGRISPYPYRRQLLAWADMIIYPDGFGVETRLSLDYPLDQYDRYERGIPAFYYRRGPFYQTVAIERKTKLWYRRFNEKMLFRTTVTGRFGFNGYDHTQFDYLNFINLFNLGATISAAVEFRPPYHEGFFLGAGVLAGINLISALDDIRPSPKLIKGGVPLDTFELGVILTAGFRRP